MKKRSLWVTLAVLIAVSMPVAADDFYTASKTKELGEPTETEALVCFLRPAFAGKAIRFWAFADQTPIGVTRGKQFTCGLVPPGKHIFWSKAENVSALESEVEAGQTYFFKQTVRMGALKARVKMETLSEAAAQQALKKCKKRTELTEAGKARAEEIVAEKWDNAQIKAGTGDTADEGDEAAGAEEDEG